MQKKPLKLEIPELANDTVMPVQPEPSFLPNDPYNVYLSSTQNIQSVMNMHLDHYKY